MAIKFEKPFLSLTREEEEDDEPLTGGGTKKRSHEKNSCNIWNISGARARVRCQRLRKGGRGSTVIGSDEKSKAKSHRFFLSIYLSSREMKSVFFFFYSHSMLYNIPYRHDPAQ